MMIKRAKGYIALLILYFVIASTLFIMIETKNDCKEKYQSWEAETNQDGSDGMGHYNAQFTGYGATEYEAKQNLIQQVDNLIKNLKRIKNQVDV